MEISVFEEKSSQDPSWPHLGPIWVAKRGPRGGLWEAKLGSKRVRKSEAKKGLVLGGQGGDLPPIYVWSLAAGIDKGETAWHLPPSLPVLVCPSVC